MKLRFWIIPVMALFLAGTALVALRSEVKASAKTVNPGAFWHFITNSDPYIKWSFMPGYMGIYPGNSPHGKYLRLYVNGIALDALNKGHALPSGSILVKENYDEDMKTLLAITPMYKIQGSNPAAGDWFWAKYTPDGKVLASGAPNDCVSCHSTVKSKDWIFTWPR